MFIGSGVFYMVYIYFSYLTKMSWYQIEYYKQNNVFTCLEAHISKYILFNIHSELDLVDRKYKFSHSNLTARHL